MPIRSNRFLLLTSGALVFGCGRPDSPASPPAITVSPEVVASELLAADSGFASAGAASDVATSISAMYAPDVTVPAPGGKFAEGSAAAIELLRSNPDNLTSHAWWQPIRVGVSADGLHGFTFGYGTTTRPDRSRLDWKYLAYWVKGPSGWRVVVYKRSPRPAGEVSLARMPAAIPIRFVASSDSSTVAGFRASLDSAERSFSEEAQRIGLGPAFVKWGRADAVNMGGPNAAGFVVGSEAIGESVGRGGPSTGSPVSWAPERVVIAASGDLGVTIGLIRPNGDPPAGAAPAFPFFTIWYRTSPADPWRYIAE